MRGHIRRRSRDSWELTIDLGRDADGKRVRRFHHVKGTRRDAERELAARIHQVQTGSYTDPSKETVATYLNRWLRDYARTSVAPRTYDRYEQIVRVHLIPALGSMKLSALRPLHIVQAEQQWMEPGGGRGGRPLSPRTVLHHHRLLREALAQAVRWHILVVNPADAVTPPRPVRKEMRALTAEQTARLLAAAGGDEHETAITVAVYTGLRVGELLGLRWADVDLDRGRLSVRQALQPVPGGGITFRAPKTHRSQRSVSLSLVVIEALHRESARQAAVRLVAGAAWKDGDLVFTDNLGEPLHPDRLRRSLVRLLTAAKLPALRLHDLRHHTMATLMLAAGEHPKVVSERLGHATVGITLDTYSHVLPGLQEAAADRLEAAVIAARPKAL